MVKVRSRCGSVYVDSPRGVSSRATDQEWLSGAAWASAIFPTICVHMCSVAYVSFHSSYGSDGHCSFSVTMLVRWIMPECPHAHDDSVLEPIDRRGVPAGGVDDHRRRSEPRPFAN